MRKILLFLAAIMILGSAAPVLADDYCYGRSELMPDGTVSSPCNTPKCYRGLNATGEVIPWVKSKQQCRTQSVGQSWGIPAHYENFYRDLFKR
ncbi:hypothetical protein LJB86_03855 [Deltaproteobacteria bacterium OttesenSCG-928-M10]|nr:hypothetical protein [Deltaproteobacteria bacterium OttesenSCG-928-M10]